MPSHDDCSSFTNHGSGVTMKILLWCDDLMSRMRLESAWKAAGATVLKKKTTEVPDCIVIDLAVRNACEHITRLRNDMPADVPLSYVPYLFTRTHGVRATRAVAEALGAELGY